MPPWRPARRSTSPSRAPCRTPAPDRDGSHGATRTASRWHHRAIAGAAATLTIRLTPRASHERLAAGPDGSFVAHVTAPPVEGAANEALCRLVARAAGVPPSRVEVVRGHRGRRKVVRVAGLEDAAVRERIGAGFPAGGR